MNKTLNALLLISLIAAPVTSLAGKQYTYDVPIQKRVETDLTERCDSEIARYKKIVNEHPNSSYDKYMLNVWQRRCANGNHVVSNDE